MQLRRFAVIGHPIGHTMSPFIHDRLFSLTGHKPEYSVLDVPSLTQALPALRTLDGFNITIPHKSDIIPLLDGIDEKAKLFGSVNTVRVEDGKMTLHISLVSKNIVNLFPGLAEDAQKDDAELLQPTTDTVTYKDGLSDEVYGFDVPVEALDQDFDLAIIGTKGKWYDHTVSVSNPEEMNDDNKLPVEVAEDEAEDTENTAEDTEDAE